MSKRSIFADLDAVSTTKESVAEVTKGAYHGTSCAGTGMFGNVWFCVRLNQSTQKDAEMLHAVKINSRKEKGIHDPDSEIQRHLSGLLAKEIQGLKKIADLPHTAQHNFQKLLGYDTSPLTEGYPRWIAIRAVLCCTLMQILAVRAEPIPRPLVLNIALQAYTAIQTLHDHKLHMMHGDIHARNAMLDIERRDEHGVPTLVFIDLEDRKSDFNDFRYLDRRLLSIMIGDLLRGHIDAWQRMQLLKSEVNQDNDPLLEAEDPRWIAFVDQIKGGKDHELEDVRVTIEDYACKAWKNMSDHERAEIEDLLEKASEEITKTLAEAKEVLTEHAAKQDGSL